jgi:hypothetical protein
LENKEVVKLHNQLGSDFTEKNWAEMVYKRALRGAKLSILPCDFKNSHSIYLLDKSKEDVQKLIEDTNLIIEGIDYDFSKSISPTSFASCLVDKEMTGIEKIEHRCKNIVLLEPYIFTPSNSRDKVPKIPNLVKLLKQLFIHDRSIHCNLAIVTSRSQSEKLINDGIDDIKNQLNNPLLEVCVYKHAEGAFQDNRHIVTDYSIMDLQHMFDRDNASISINYSYDGDIKTSFTRINSLLDRIKKSYQSDPPKFGLETVKFGELLSNALFQ